MFRSQYDSDVTVWSPQGRLHQVEYAMEAVNLGSATVGLKSKDTAVLVALRRPTSELSSSQRKIIPIDEHLGISIAGITADARVLSHYLRSECLNYKFAYDSPHPVSRLISNLGNKMQVTTQRYDRRPYGVGLLVAGYDNESPYIYQVDPSANFFNCKAMSIGGRSQSARTYLERNLDAFQDCSKDELIRHGVTAILGSLPNGEDQAQQLRISVAFVGEKYKFQLMSEEDCSDLLDKIKDLRGAGPSRDGGGGGSGSGGDDDGDDGRPPLGTVPSADDGERPAPRDPEVMDPAVERR